MSILRNQRYSQFENGTKRDAFRGLPLQQFPWVLESRDYASATTELVWQMEVACLDASPSGFGSKLNFKIRAHAKLSRESLEKHLHENQIQSRVKQLFSCDLFSFEHSCFSSCEGTLEELPKMGQALLRTLKSQLDTQWSSEKICNLHRNHLRQSSPGGFGERLF